MHLLSKFLYYRQLITVTIGWESNHLTEISDRYTPRRSLCIISSVWLLSTVNFVLNSWKYESKYLPFCKIPFPFDSLDNPKHKLIVDWNHQFEQISSKSIHFSCHSVYWSMNWKTRFSSYSNNTIVHSSSYSLFRLSCFQLWVTHSYLE